jgi:transcriptional regulator with XRE-family HTH domain
MIPSMTTGDRLRRARKAAGISSAQMAKLLSVDPNTISNYENDKTTRYPGTRMRAWAEITGVPVEWLLEGREVASGQAIPGCPWIVSLSSGHDQFLTAA